MSVAIAQSLDDALAALAASPESHLLAGGTDLMVEVNEGHRRPESVVVIDRVPELSRWHRNANDLTIGAGVTYQTIEESELATLAPGLAQASRTVGSPQIRAAGTIGGNVGTASPAGDTLPVLAALDAVVGLCSLGGRRELPLSEFITGVKRTALAPGELIEFVRVPVLRGPQEYLKVGTRNAMVIAVSAVALVVDLDSHAVRVGLGSVAPTPVRATAAEEYINQAIDWATGSVADTDATEFRNLVMAAASPIDDQRSTATYRRHSIGVMATRALRRAFPSGGAA